MKRPGRMGMHKRCTRIKNACVQGKHKKRPGCNRPFGGGANEPFLVLGAKKRLG